MSRFDYYAQKMDRIARMAFDEYKREADILKRAEEQKKRFPQLQGMVTADYAATSARAQAEYLDAVNHVERVRQKMTDGEYAQQIADLRRVLAEDVANAYKINPNQIDANALELLKSGVMEPSEYQAMLSDAVRSGNPTMARLVGKYAGDAAKAGSDGPTTAKLRAVEMESRRHSGNAYLDAFDWMTNVFNKCCGNPHMMGAWGELTGETVENF